MKIKSKVNRVHVLFRPLVSGENHLSMRMRALLVILGVLSRVILARQLLPQKFVR